MKQLITLTGSIAAFLLSFTAFTQNVGIGTNTPNASAKLHIEDANRGLLIPNVNLTDVAVAAPVTTPATGLLVWNTNGTVTGGNGAGFYYWTGTQWLQLSTGTPTNDWALLGNAGTNPVTNFVGTTDNQALAFRTNNVENMRINTNGNVGIGTAVGTNARLYVNTPATNTVNAYGIYNNNDGSSTGATYGIRTNNYTSTNSTKYGIYNVTNNEGTGNRYGFYNSTSLSATSSGAAFGIYNYVTTSGAATAGTQYGIYNYLSSSAATGTHYGQRNLVYLNPAATGISYGEFTYVDYTSGTRYGEYKSMATSTSGGGTVYGDFNLANGTGPELIFGMASEITNTGTGTHYGLYSNVPGGTNDFAAVFYAGNVVANEIGGNYDFRIEGDTRIYSLWVDANEDLVRFGTGNAGSDYQNGNVIGAVTVDYVVDFDNAAATGTAIGIGSIEYLLDGSSETTINNRFSPATDNILDLGSAALRWDDVYATNGTIITSDMREKQDVVPMGYGLNEVMQLRPVTYKWKNSKKGSTTITDDQKEVKLGLIAQEVQLILPEVVQTHDWKPVSEEQPDVYERFALERLGMSYHEIVPVLIKATQEQQALIESQNEELSEMRKELDELKRLILKQE